MWHKIQTCGEESILEQAFLNTVIQPMLSSIEELIHVCMLTYQMVWLRFRRCTIILGGVTVAVHRNGV